MSFFNCLYYYFIIKCFNVKPTMPVGFYTNFTLLPQYLNTLGYQSHAIGKWVTFGGQNKYYFLRNKIISYFIFKDGI